MARRTVLGIVAVAMALLLSPGLRRLLRLQRIYQRLPIAHHIAAAGNAADLYRQRLGGLGKAILMTVGAQVLWICSIGLIGTSLQLHTPFHSYLVYIPLIYIIGSIPITPGGVGIIEIAYVSFFWACEPSQVLGLAIMARMMDILRSLPGAIIYIAGPKVPKAGAMEAELAAAEEDVEKKDAETR